MTEMNVEQLEERLRHAMLTSDVVKLDRLVSDRLVFVMYDGTVLTKSDDLAAHRSKKIRLTKLSPSERQTQFYGDVAIVTVRMALVGSFLVY